MSGDAPAFPPFKGTEQLPQVLTTRIAAVAWEKSAGNEDEFRRLCLQHVRGDIDLFADRPLETDATERMRAIQDQEAIERSVTLPAAAAPVAVEGPAERAAPIAGSREAAAPVDRRPDRPEHPAD